MSNAYSNYTKWLYSRVTGATTGSIPFAGANGLSQDNANLFWDAANARLGIATNAPITTFNLNKNFTTTYPLYTDLNGSSTELGSTLFQQTYTNPTITTTAMRGHIFRTQIAMTSDPGAKNILGNYFELGTVAGDTTSYATSTFRTTNQVAVHNGSGALSKLEAVLGVSINRSTATVGAVYPFGGVLQNVGGGTITHAIAGTAVGTITGITGTVFSNTSGTIVNTYGHYIGTLTGGTQTNLPYSIYSSDLNARLYHAGTAFFKSETSFGGVVMGVATKPAAYTIATNDYLIRADATVVAFAVNLPTAASSYDSTNLRGDIYIIKKVDATANAVTVTANGTENIDAAVSATTYVLATKGKYVMVQSNGTSWDVIGHN